MKWRPIYYDTETTGLSAEKDRIIEIAAFDPVLDKTFVSLINPGCLIPKEASQIHHIDDAMVQNAPSFKEVADQFCEFCSGDIVLIAHNNDAFDKHFLRYEFTRIERTLPDWRFLDSLKWARKYRPDLPRHNLQFLREYFGLPANQAHRALDDVIILAKVFELLIDDLPLHRVMELLEKGPSSISRMPFGKHQGTPIEKVPKDYLKWLSKSGALDKPENAALKAAVELVLASSK